MDDPSESWHREILTDAQRQALAATQDVLTDVPGAFLAGGTALALRYGHRRSRDLDWFTTATFDHLAIAGLLGRIPDTVVIQAEPGTIQAECSGIALSLIRYRYPVDPPDRCGTTPLASLRTAAGMKLLAIVNRGYKRDFIDIAEMIRHGVPLPRLAEWAMADIPGLTMETILRSLAWRDDAEAQPDPEGIDAAKWRTVQRELDQAISDIVR